MAIDVSGVARIRHADTGAIYVIDPEELEWDEVGADERQMGPEVTHEAVIDHPDLGHLSWTVWEYPVGAYNDQDHDVGRHQLLENFRLGVSDHDGLAEDREGRIERMVEWFLDKFEDPANSQPYESAEGGYIWIDGGPYDAREQIGDQFSGEDQVLIDAAIERVERGGIVDWARIDSPREYEERLEPEPDEEPNEEPDEESVFGAAPNPSDEPALADILGSIGAPQGPLLTADDENRIELIGWIPSASADRTLLEVLQDQAADLLNQLAGSNGHPELLAAVQRYAGALGQDPASIPHLYSEGVFLENTAAWTAAAIQNDDRPPLPGSSAATLDTIRELHGVMIAGSAEGTALLEAAARYRRAPEDQESLNRSLAQVADLVAEANTVFGPEVRALVQRAAAEAGKGSRPERSNQTSIGIVATVITAAATAVGISVFETIVGGGLAATPVATALQQGVTTLANAAGTFIVDHVDALRVLAANVGSELQWLRQLTDWIRTRRSGGDTP